MSVDLGGIDCPTHQDICTFCNEVSGSDTVYYELGIASSRNDYILHETESFIVVPCVGALTDWYILIVPRKHVLSSGWLGENERAELRSLTDDLVSKLRGRTGKDVVVFEHGSYSFRDKGGSCHDHSHVHVVVTERPVADFVELVSQHVDFSSCEDWIASAAELVSERHRSYLAIESHLGSMIATANQAPSAFFRKALVAWLGGEPGEHDWLVFPHTERLQAMLATGIR